MKRVLVTHADEPLGRRVVKTLYHDPDVAAILAVGAGPAPRAFDRFLAEPGPRVRYARADLARHRSASDLFHSTRFREARVDTLVHVPQHGAPAAADGPLLAGVSRRTAEARLVLQNALEAPPIRHLVAVGSAFVYRLPPGNANRLCEDSELDLDPAVPPEIRSWIDCDMLFHGEVHNDRLRVALLRVPTVVAAGGYVYLNPLLEGRPGLRLRSAGFDPICALVSDKDVARAVRAAVHGSGPGIYNVAGAEAVPLSVLCRWTGRPSVPMPGPLLGWLGTAARWAGHETAPLASGYPRLRYGFTLDTRRAASELGFHPQQRVGLARGGDGQPILETAPV